MGCLGEFREGSLESLMVLGKLLEQFLVFLKYSLHAGDGCRDFLNVNTMVLRVPDIHLSLK